MSDVLDGLLIGRTRHRSHLRRTAIWLIIAVSVASPPVLLGNDAVASAGDVLGYGMPAFAAGMTLSHRDGPGALQFGEAGLLAMGLTAGLKYAVNERRPNGESYSLPSAHAASAFFSAEFLRKRYGWKFGVPAYALASFVGYSRVEADVHFAHDVVAGAIIGIGSSYLFTKPYQGWRIGAAMGVGYYGLRFDRQW